MEVQILKPEYKTAIKDNPFLKAEIAAVNKVSTYTVDRWRWNNDAMLTTVTNLNIIRRYLSLGKTAILTEAAGSKETHASVV